MADTRGKGQEASNGNSQKVPIITRQGGEGETGGGRKEEHSLSRKSQEREKCSRIARKKKVRSVFNKGKEGTSQAKDKKNVPQDTGRI